MGRPAIHPPLRVYLNNRLVGHFMKRPDGAVSFSYDKTWLGQRGAFPISLSLPLREEAYRGEAVSAVFENLLPDSDALRRRVAEKVGARGTDAYNMLARIGRDCVGALQFIVGDAEHNDGLVLEGESIDDVAIERILKNLVQAPLGLDRDDDFRISVAGAQEKTALLFHQGQWIKPHGTTPTTHIFKTPIGTLPNGIDLSDSVENEYFCLKLAEAFGLPVNLAEIKTFGETKALVIERFDRRMTEKGMLLRLPQEDCCQALSVPPSLKYQNEGGPGITAILDLLKASDTPLEDQTTFFAAQVFFWMIGATDGHAKNFSVFLQPSGRFQLTPLYDILSAQPSLDQHQISRRQMKLAMSVGDNRHYRIDNVHPRHFEQTAKASGVSLTVLKNALSLIAGNAESAFDAVSSALPNDFPEEIVTSIRNAAQIRIRSLRATLEQLDD